MNADGYVTTGQGVLSYNMFAYCGNNPVNYSDPSGCASKSLKDIWNAFKDFVVDKVISKMKRSPKSIVSSAGDGLNAGKEINDRFNPNGNSDLDISQNVDIGINIKKQIVEDMVTIGTTGEYVSKTPDDFWYPDVNDYNEYCLKKYNSVYMSSEWSWVSEEERKAVLVDNMLLWDPINTIKIGIIQGVYGATTLIEETAEMLS